MISIDSVAAEGRAGQRQAVGDGVPPGTVPHAGAYGWPLNEIGVREKVVSRC
jgi:hypothetical protein